VTFLIGGYFAAKYNARSLALDTVTNCSRYSGVTFAVMMCVASATRIGYVIYPLNFALWSAVTQDHKVAGAGLVSH